MEDSLLKHMIVPLEASNPLLVIVMKIFLAANSCLLGVNNWSQFQMWGLCSLLMVGPMTTPSVANMILLEVRALLKSWGN